jgi:ATP-dependent protease ClpP protease subunit
MFCAGGRRISVPHARFGFHPNVFHVRQETLGIGQLEEKANQLRVEHDYIAAIIADTTTLSVEDAKALINDHKSLKPTEAKECGLVHSVERYRLPEDTPLAVIGG